MEALNPSTPYDVFAVEQAHHTETVHFPGEGIVEQVHAEHPEIEERGYQIDCLGALAFVRQQGERRGLIHMATGLGKTTVAALDVKAFLQDQTEARVLFVAHQKYILRQAQDRFKHILGDDYSYGSFTGDSRRNINAGCMFASFQALHRSREVFDPHDFDYVVVDESHHGKATTYEPTIQYFKPQFLLGMTATPERRDLREIRDIFGNEIYAKPLDVALSERLLARPDYRVILDDIDDSVLKDNNVTKAELNRTVFIPKRDEQIVDIINEKASKIKDPKAIIFCPSIEHADRIAGLIEGAQSFHSGLNRLDRRHLLDNFVSGTVPALTTVDMFNEGIDVADANIIVFLRSTQSRTIFQQQLGRGLRKTPEKESVLVLDFVANCDRLLMIDELLGGYTKTQDGGGRITDSEGGIRFGQIDDLYSTDFTGGGDPLGYQEIDIASVEFSETSRRILEILKQIKHREASEASLNQEAAITYYRTLCRTLGRVAQHVDIREAYKNGEGPSRWQLLTSFDGSLRELRKAADISDKWTAEDSVRVYRAISEKLGRPATLAEIDEHRAKNEPTHWQLLGPFNRKFADLKRAAGYEVNYEHRSWTHLTSEDAVAYYQALSDYLGHPASKIELDEAAKSGEAPSFMSLARHCEGSINTLRQMAGYEPLRKEYRGMTSKDAVEYFQDLSRKLGKVASVDDVILAGKTGDGPALSTLTKYFDGKIANLQEAAGYSARQKAADWDEKRCIEYYLELSDTLGRWPTLEDIRALSNQRKGPSTPVLLRHHKSMKALREAATEYSQQSTDHHS